MHRILSTGRVRARALYSPRTPRLHHTPTVYAGKQPMLPLHTGLEEKSVDKYVTEWSKYTKFCVDKGLVDIPGRDCSFSMRVMRDFLDWRNNIRSIAGIKSKLKHCGI